MFQLVKLISNCKISVPIATKLRDGFKNVGNQTVYILKVWKISKPNMKI